MASTNDDSMTLDSRTPSRSSTPTPSILCQSRIDLTDDIQRYSILIQGTNDTLNSLQRYGNFNPEDTHVLHLRSLLQSYSSNHHLAVSEFSSLSPCDTPDCPYHHTPHSTPSKNPQNSQETVSDNALNGDIVKNISHKRKDNEDGFITPLLSKIEKFKML
ncbi:hypothetical protein TNIN_18281 [Trichonephila inaurata madagascariensis]|uniref:Uncharacterized protein n=1 Tax=Trichonephila inaurata madagascariensis TaxID=2747483 RepID=A0A8X7BV41_9ARAC|nr:hypothetical protein TNIN_18281 [Trichonephila inaurata madagascariensis]